MKINACLSRESDEWATPTDLFNALNEEFNFTLDPCATKMNATCARFFTKEEDGLKQSWHGETVFCNPPYSQLKHWIKKSSDEAANGATVVMLIPARTDTKAFHDYIYGKAEIRFIKGRLKFSGSKTGAPFPSMIVVFKPLTTGDGTLPPDV